MEMVSGRAGRHPARRKIRILQNKANPIPNSSGAWAGSFFDARSLAAPLC